MPRKLLTALVGGLALASVPAAAAAARLSPDEQLARELRGRVAGPPVDCINLRNVRSSRVITDTAIIYDAGHTIYVNRPRAGARSLNRWDTQVQRTFDNRLCSIDTVRMVDLPSGFLTGIVFLGEFVPYRRLRD